LSGAGRAVSAPVTGGGLTLIDGGRVSITTRLQRKGGRRAPPVGSRQRYETLKVLFGPAGVYPAANKGRIDRGTVGDT